MCLTAHKEPVSIGVTWDSHHMLRILFSPSLDVPRVDCGNGLARKIRGPGRDQQSLPDNMQAPNLFEYDGTEVD